MPGLAIAFGIVSVVVWLYLLLARGRFWRVDRLFAEPGRTGSARGSIAVVIPARNEAASIGEAVRSLLGQTCRESLHIFVVDDHSSDGTAMVAREAASSTGFADQLTVIAGAALPTGWTGKLWAVQQGVEQALVLQPGFLLLTDADIRHSPGSVAALLGVAECGAYDLASFMVKLHCETTVERLLIPAFVFFFFLLYPPEWIRDPHRKSAGAAGGCMLVRPEALVHSGGIAAIRDEIIDDCALARAIKRAGGKVWLGVTADTVSLRAYESCGEVAQMIARTAFNQLQHSSWLLAGALAGLVVAYLLPILLLFSGRPVAMLLGGFAYLLMSLSYLPMVRFYRLKLVWALTLPCAAAFYMAATFLSAMKYWSGHGGEWKGRAQDV
jgi:hopene-associated glycosyltransferase HpnB